MGANEHPFKTLPPAEPGGELRQLLARERTPTHAVPAPAAALPGMAPVTARLHGFGLQGEPLLAGLPGCAGELVPARSTVTLRRATAGAQVLVLFENADPVRPIVIGVLQEAPGEVEAAQPGGAHGMEVSSDGERLVFTAEREIVLRCGEASIVLTRAGKVLIRGSYILSRSSGYNKLKGAAIDIN
ncbi:DUF6484 domain-containing protein [Variovorax sp. OV329]|uniref:DUF6484 domain-containing protein n=1 Tax=Variovorax sp. OV329 TaxID=1882825 RepID=UPI0008E027DB|nr:DUF6484 domain-containing protein [Variovorax sp. OV329]SFM81161.1 hypothetical protein SAMN05444747_10940 [Variovorax sp. OV329]